MARLKLSEFRAKKLLFAELGLDYSGLNVDLTGDYAKAIKALPARRLYVAKVDQAVKKRGQQGLVKIKRSKAELIDDLKAFTKQGYKSALVEPYIQHAPEEETYLALSRVADGIRLSYSAHGGIDVEASGSKVSHLYLGALDDTIASYPEIFSRAVLAKIFTLFQRTHMNFLEINPLISQNGVFIPLDAAVEVDGAAQFFVNGAWMETDIREANKYPSPGEEIIKQLNAKSPASLSYKVLNPDGSLFLLLSGGGASVVIADELAQKGRHKDIANYGEYSGNPSEDETYIYTKEILRLMLNSKARKKVLIIAGGVANFTDVAKTFAGIIRAMRESAAEIKKQKIRVFVRRGGPNQKKGLKAMSDFLEDIAVSNVVYGPEKSLAELVAQVTKATA